MWNLFFYLIVKLMKNWKTFFYAIFEIWRDHTYFINLRDERYFYHMRVLMLTLWNNISTAEFYFYQLRHIVPSIEWDLSPVFVFAETLASRMTWGFLWTVKSHMILHNSIVVSLLGCCSEQVSNKIHEALQLK